MKQNIKTHMRFKVESHNQPETSGQEEHKSLRLPRWLIRAVVFSAVTLWGNCFIASQPPAVSSTQKTIQAPADPRVRGLVTITHVASDNWRFTYDLSRDARSIFLGPKTEKYHAASWELPDGFYILVEGPYSYLERRDGKPFRQVAIDVTSYRQIVPYAPQPFGLFDQGTAVNTGPLGFAARVGEARMMMSFLPKYSFVGLPDETVLVPGKKRGMVTEIDLPSQGLFVYFGKLQGLYETDRTQSILDTRFPSTLRKPYLSAVKAYASFYDRRLPHSAPEKLVIMVSYQVDNDPLVANRLLSLGGNAQHFQIMAKARGPQTLTADRQDIQKMQRFFAHEMAHIWQTSLGRDNARWFNEGEAEMLALYALEHHGHITHVEVAQNLSARVPQCVESLRRTSLLEAHRRGEPQANYTAGALVIASALSAISADGTQEDITALDRALQTRPISERRKQPLEAFQATLKQLGAEPKAVDAIGTFIRVHHDDPFAAVRLLFDSTGLAYSVDGTTLTIEPVRNAR
ncbi:MAG TPA: hypothetical protein EYN93_16385 [Planctomycetaceae bacterium]|nr:hypothetical protein [Planctomycetaceae bacterium]